MDEEKRQETHDAISQSDFVARLKECIGDESVRSFAKRAGLSPSGVRACIAGSSDPSRTAVQKMAIAAKRDPSWLAYGTEPNLAHSTFLQTPSSLFLKLFASLKETWETSEEPFLVTDLAEKAFGEANRIAREHPNQADYRDEILDVLEEERERLVQRKNRHNSNRQSA